MPVYEFECGACGRVLEILVRSGDKKPRCSCGSLKLKKAFSVPSIISKGGSSKSKSSSSSSSSSKSCSRRSCSGCRSHCH